MTEPDSTVAEISGSYLALIAEDGDLKRPLRGRLHREIEELRGRSVWPEYLRLSAACAVRAWPVWQARFDDELPHASPEAEATTERPALRLAGDRAGLNKLNTFLDNRLRLGSDAFPAVAAGLACWAANRDVLLGRFAAPVELDEGEVDSEDWEASLYASVAVAGGAVWDGAGDRELRRAFWEWYLTDGVPRAYAEV